MQKESRKIVIMIAVILAITGFPYLKEGLCAYFPDLMYHLLRIEGVKDAFLAGEFPSRIYYNFYNGYGYGSPLFYPDVFLVFPAILRLFSVSPITVWKIFALTVTAIGTLSTYYSIKYICKDVECSVTAAFVIMLSQFYLADLQLRAGISEYIAFIFIPILIAGIYDFFVYDGKKVYLMGIAFVGLLMSHSIMTVIGILLTVAIFVRMMFVKRADNYLFNVPKIKRLVFTAVFTVLITSFYWAPMLEQLATLKLRCLEPWANIGNYTQSISNFFRLTGTFSTNAYIGIGLPLLPMMVMALFMKKPNNQWSVAFLLGGWGLFLATTDLLPWKLLEKTPINMLQFTYRLWPYAIVFSVFGITMILAENLNGKYVKYKKYILTVIIVCAALMGMLQNRMTAGVTSPATRVITEEYLYENNNYVGAGEWLPIGIDKEIINLTAETNVINGKGKTISLTRNQEVFQFKTNKGVKKYTLPLIYYKGYNAWIEAKSGIKAKIEVSQSDNLLVQVRNNSSMSGKIHVKYTGTTIQTISEAISLFAIAALLVYGLYQHKNLGRRIEVSKEIVAFAGVGLFLLSYFMMLFDFPNILTVIIGTVICAVLMYKQKKIRFNLGTVLLGITIVSYFIIRYGFVEAIVMGLPYVGILIYVLADYLTCEIKTKEKSEQMLLIIFFMIVLGYTIHGFLNSYMYLEGFRTKAGRHWYDFWMNIPLPATEQVVYFLPVLSLIFPAIIYFRKNKLLNVFIMISSAFFIYISWISNSRMSIFIFPLVFVAQAMLYVLLEWEKMKKIAAKRKRLLISVFVCALIALVLFVATDNMLISALKDKLGRDGGIFGSERFVAQRLALQQLFVYPMGGSHMDFGIISYAHNTWLDMANRAGLIPFFAFSAYTFWTVYEMLIWLTKKEISTRRKLMVAGVYGAFILYYTVERGIDNSMHFMTPWFFINGMVHGELAAIKENNK